MENSWFYPYNMFNQHHAVGSMALHSGATPQQHIEVSLNCVSVLQKYKYCLWKKIFLLYCHELIWLFFIQSCDPHNQVLCFLVIANILLVCYNPSCSSVTWQLGGQRNVHWLGFNQVSTLQLHDLPGCDVTMLSQCVSLKSLVINNCGVVAVDSIASLPQLQYVDIKVLLLH